MTFRFITATKFIDQDGEEPTYIRPEAIVALQRSGEPSHWLAYCLITLGAPADQFYISAEQAFQLLGDDRKEN